MHPDDISCASLSLSLSYPLTSSMLWGCFSGRDSTRHAEFLSVANQALMRFLKKMLGQCQSIMQYLERRGFRKRSVWPWVMAEIRLARVCVGVLRSVAAQSRFSTA